MKEDKESHYVYVSVYAKTGEFYIGYHYGKRRDRYYGSGKWPKAMKKKKVKLRKKVIKCFSNSREARQYEKEMIVKYDGHAYCRNQFLINMKRNRKDLRSWHLIYTLEAGDVADEDERRFWRSAREAANRIAKANGWKIQVRWLNEENVGRIRRIK